MKLQKNLLMEQITRVNNYSSISSYTLNYNSRLNLLNELNEL